MRRLRHLTGQHRTAATNRLLGGLLAFNAGAFNAGAINAGANRIKLRRFGTLLAMFITGGLGGAIGFKYVGFVWVMPLAFLLLAPSLPPLWADFQRLNRLRKARLARRHF